MLRECPPNCGAHAPLAHLYEQRFVYQLDDTVVNTTSAATLGKASSEQPFFVRESISWPFESILSHGLDVPDARHAAAGPSGPTTIFATTRNYYHWLIEELPLVLRAVEAVPGVKVLAFQDGITAKHHEVATRLGFALLPSPKTVHLTHHVLPGRASDSWFIHPSDAVRLMQFGRTMPGGSEPSHLYISRRNTTRSFDGESELEQRLAARGFTIVVPDQLSWVEQVALFRNARIVVGPHGAGLSNLVFTEPGATVIELTNGNHYNRCFEWICHVSGHNYRMVSPDDGLITSVQRLEQAILDNLP